MRTIVAVAVLVAMGAQVRSETIPPDQLEFFETRIRPVLVQHCYECHNSGQSAEGDLALDHRAAMLRGGAGGPVLAKLASSSRLMQVIRHELEGLEMPEGGAKLDDAVIADFARWIDMGAPDPRDGPPSEAELSQSTSWPAIRDKRKNWWSFQPIRAPALPPASSSSWSDQLVDRFVAAKLSTAGLSPSPRADRHVLVRRLYFALIGLPPTPQQIDQFVRDDSPDAYERLVDQLLQSPHFGERWARHWMDWIRYAESHGSEGDPPIAGAHHYRDYLIRALNADVPYDQLVREHVAGDLLEQPRINAALGINESLIGTAHWRMVFHGFAPTDALDEKVRFTDDAIAAFTKAFLGLTVACARCHDHKFDPISQADYYALFGILGSTRPGRAAIDVPERLTANDTALDELKTRLRGVLSAHWQSSLGELPQRLIRGAETVPDPATADTTHQQLLRAINSDQTQFAANWQRLVDQHQAVLQGDAQRQQAAQRWDLSVNDDAGEWFGYGSGLSDSPGPSGSFAVTDSGPQILRGIYPGGVYSHLHSSKHAAVLSSPEVDLDDDYRLWLRVAGDGNALVRYAVQNYPRSGTVYPVNRLNSQPGADGESPWHWQSYDLSYWRGDKIHIELTTAMDSAVLVTEDERSWFGIREALLVKTDHAGPPPTAAEFLLPLFQAAQQDPPQTGVQLADLYRRVLGDAIESWNRGTISDAQALMLNHALQSQWLDNNLADVPAAQTLIDRYRNLEADIPVATRVPTLAEWQGADQPLFQRGDHKQPRQAVPRRFLEVIDDQPYDAALSGRRELAEDLIRTDNPLTSRVIVNRIWHHLFGQAIVQTPDNFGRLGREPSHPELLDYLASEFRGPDHWSIKTMIRRLVTSETWQQDSVPTAQSQQIDPTNQWLSHFPLRRLEAEAIRDSLMSVSGRLDRTLYGPPAGSNTPRRAIYVSVIRNQLDPFLTAFDAPVPFTSTGRRDATNVPAQSLLLMNNPLVIKAAEQFARRGIDAAVAQDDAARIEWMWRSALGRPPTDDQLHAAQQFVQRRADQYAQHQSAIQKLQSQLDRHQAAIAALMQQAASTTPATTAAAATEDLKPIAAWDFAGGGNDTVGDLDLRLHGTAAIVDGALQLDGQGWAASGPIGGEPLTEKTIEAVVRLSSLGQRGGGVISVQTLDGNLFDAIVYGERQPQRWFAGSNSFARSQDFAGPAEDQADQHPVHVVITYRRDGQVRGYRNGEPYGNAYVTELHRFAPQQSQVVLGMRHGQRLNPQRMLTGQILSARLYDRALSPQQVATAAQQFSSQTAAIDLLTALDDSQRQRLAEHQQRSAELQRQLNQLGGTVPADQPWIDLAHSLLNLKEFVYVR